MVAGEERIVQRKEGGDRGLRVRKESRRQGTSGGFPGIHQEQRLRFNKGAVVIVGASIDHLQVIIPAIER